MIGADTGVIASATAAVPRANDNGVFRSRWSFAPATQIIIIDYTIQRQDRTSSG